MKNTVLFLFLTFSSGAFSQTIYVPGGFSVSGIGNNTTNSNVGIGTPSPGYKLHVYTSTNLDGLKLEHSNGAWQNIFSPSLTGGAFNGITQSGDAGIIFGNVNGVNTVTNGFVIAPHRSTSSGLRIDNMGNVGIGTSNPSSKLDVSDANTDLAILKLRNLAWACNQRTSIEFWNGGNKNYPTSRIVSQMDGCGGDGEALSFETQTSGQTTPSPKLIIKNSGNVGIGTISPATKLTVGNITNGLLSTTGVALGSDQNSIEFLHSSFGSGYGAKLYGLDQGNGLTSFRLAVRGNSSTWTDALFVKAGDNGNGGGNLGYIGIGSTNPDARLTVVGQIHANEVKVDLNVPGPDYVFEKDYPLTSLEDIKTYIDQNKHLPEVPSAKEMEKNGVQLGEMNMLLLKKIEEITLHMIDQQKEIKELKEEVKNLKSK